MTAGGAITFGPVEIDGTNTRAVISGFSSNNVIPSVGNLTIDPGQDDTNTQLALNDSDLEITGNVVNDGTLSVGAKELRFVSGSSQLISSPNQDLTFADMFVSNTSTSSITLESGTNLAISDTLEIGQGKVTIGSNSTLSVDGALALFGSEEVGGAFRNGVAVDATATNAELVLTSTETTEGYVLYRDFDGGGTIDGRVDGNVIKERFMNIGQAWYFLGTPEEATTNDTFSEFFEQGGQNDLHLQGFPGADQDQDNSDNAANVYQYDEAVGGDEDFGFEVIPSATTTMESGRGYILFAFRDDDFSTGGQQGGFPKLLDTRVEMPSSVSFTFPVTASDPDTDGFDSTDGWNLLSNPTLAALNWETIYNQPSTTDMTSTLYIWDDVNNAYQTWNAATQSGSRVDTFSIDPHQGFFVKASGTSPALSIDDVEDIQLNGAGSFAGKSFSPTTPTSVAFRVDWSGRNNEAFVTLLEDGEFNEDALDSYQLEPFRTDGGAVSLYSTSGDGVALETNVIPGEVAMR